MESEEREWEIAWEDFIEEYFWSLYWDYI